MNSWGTARSRLIEIGVSLVDSLFIGSDLERKKWSTLNCLGTEFGCFNLCLSRRALKTSPCYHCSAKDHTANRVMSAILIQSQTETWSLSTR